MGKGAAGKRDGGVLGIGVAVLLAALGLVVAFVVAFSVSVRVTQPSVIRLPGFVAIGNGIFEPSVTEYAYDDAGRLAEETVTAQSRLLGGTTYTKRVERSYDNDGKLAERRTYSGVQKGADWSSLTRYFYDDGGRLSKEEYFEGFSRGRASWKKTFEYGDLPDGTLACVERTEYPEPGSGNFSTSKMFVKKLYDAEGYLLEVEWCNEGGVYRKSTYDRAIAPRLGEDDDDGSIAATGELASSESADGSASTVSVVEYQLGDFEMTDVFAECDGVKTLCQRMVRDDAGRLVRRQYLSSGDDALLLCKDYSYDEEGRLVRIVFDIEV